MSKIGRKPIKFSSAKVEIKDRQVSINGPKGKFTYEIPAVLQIRMEDNSIFLSPTKDTRENNAVWGLHRALLANKIKGAEAGFEKTVKIVGLGYKAQPAGKKLNFSLGYSHKIEFALPEGVEVDVDKTGQQLVFKSTDKLLLGNVCDKVRSLRPPEPYKGTGILVGDEVIIRKAGKAKAAAG